MGKAPHGGRLAAVWEYRKSSTDASKVYKPKHSERSRESLRGWNRQVLAHRRSFYEGITPYQAENIFRTNIQTAYNVGHYKRMTEPGVKALRPYWQYMEDDHTVTALATGASVAGTVIRVDDEGVAVECGGYIPAAAAAGVGG